MINIYKTNQSYKETRRVKKMTTDSWIELVSPNEKEIDKKGFFLGSR